MLVFTANAIFLFVSRPSFLIFPSRKENHKQGHWITKLLTKITLLKKEHTANVSLLLSVSYLIRDIKWLFWREFMDFFGSDPGFVSRITSRPGFVNPVQSGPGFDNPIRSGPIRLLLTPVLATIGHIGHSSQSSLWKMCILREFYLYWNNCAKMSMVTPLFYYKYLKNKLPSLIYPNFKNFWLFDYEIFSWNHHYAPFLHVPMEAYSYSISPIILLLLFFSAQFRRFTVTLLCH